MKAAHPLGRDDNPCRPIHHVPTLDAPGAGAATGRALGRAHKLLGVASLAFCIVFGVISARLVYVTMFMEAPQSQVRAEPEPATDNDQPAPVRLGRADIVDRNGAVLATMLPSPHLVAHPHEIRDRHETAVTLARYLPDQSVAQIEATLGRDVRFVYLAQNLSPSQEWQIRREGLAGIDFERHDRRFYPSGALAAHIVGYTDLDGHGQSGIERAEDQTLSTSRQPLALSVDLRLQAIVKEELQKAIDKFDAIGGAGVVMDVRTGEVLSLVSLPDFDPNRRRTAAEINDPKADKNPTNPYFNRPTQGVYEMGSVFKIFNTALAFEGDKVTFNSMFDTSPVHIGVHTIHDFENLGGPASVVDIFIKSSNCGSARMVRLSGPDTQRSFLGALGLLSPAPIEIPENATPMVPRDWREEASMTVAFGHGISVTQMQTAVAAAAIVNGGILHPATLIKHDDGYAPAGVRVVSPKTSQMMRQLMRMVVTGGTGSQAEVQGYLVGGKTGTAEKIQGGRYEKHAQLSSFIGVFPMNDPHYMVYVTIDEPKNSKVASGHATGGATAAPVVHQVIAQMAPLFGLRPVVETPEIHRAITIDTGAPAEAARTPLPARTAAVPSSLRTLAAYGVPGNGASHPQGASLESAVD